MSFSKTKLSEHELVLIEEPFAPNTIVEGVVTDTAPLTKALRAVWGRGKLGAYYAIVSIPENKIYSHIFPFPKTETALQLEEMVKLAIDFELPAKKSDAYIGYENAGDSNVINEVSISEISKTVVDKYTLALTNAGIKILALESHLASIARSIKLKLGQVTMLTKRSANGASVFIVKDGVVRFSRVIPESALKDENFLLKEAQNVKTFYESEKKAPVVELPLEQAEIRDEYLKFIDPKDISAAVASKWLIAVGAAIRGEIPKGEDNRISLLPVGTKEAYTYQKTATFIALVRNLIVGVSMFFLAAFLAAYYFTSTLSQTVHQTNSNVLAGQTSPDESKNEIFVNRVNLMTQAAASILATSPDWSILLDDINAHVIVGIVITNFSAQSITGEMNMQGTALDRTTLNDFKKSLQDSKYLTAVEIPITNLEKKGDIPFSATFHVKDPSVLYYK